MLALETVVKNGLPGAIKASNALQAYGKDLKMDLLVERMKLVLSRKKANMAIKWRAILGIDGDAAPNDGTPHSMLKALELGSTAIADFVEAVDKEAAVVKGFVLRSKNHNNNGLVAMIDGLAGAGGTCGGGGGGGGAGGEAAADPAKPTSTGSTDCKGGKKLRTLLEESEEDTGLWAAAENAVQTLRVQPPSPDKIKASLEAVVKLTGKESDIMKAWAEYQINLQALLQELGVLKAAFGKAFSYSLVANVPPVAGFKLTPYVRASVSFDHDAPPRGGSNGSTLEISGALVVGMDYAARGSSGSVTEVAFTPTMDLDHGLQVDSLIPTVSFLGSDPIPITTDPMVMLKSFATIMVTKIVAAFKSRPVSQGSFGGAFTKFVSDPSTLGWLLKPTPAPNGASLEPDVCDDVIEEHCWDEGDSLEAVAAGTAGGTTHDARAVLWCCLDGQSAHNPAVVQAAIVEADNPLCSDVHEESRAAFGGDSVTQAGKCAAAAARLKAGQMAAQALRDIADKLENGSGGDGPGGFGAIKGRMQSIGKQLTVPLKLAKTLYAQFKSFKSVIMPLLGELANSGQKRRAVRLKKALTTVVGDATSFYEQFSKLKGLATDFLKGGSGQGSIQDMLDKAKERAIRVAKEAANDLGVAKADSGSEAPPTAAAGLESEVNSSAPLTATAAAVLESGANAAADAVNKVVDAVGDAASAAKKAILFKGAQFVAEIEAFFAHLEEFTTAFLCFVGAKQGPGCAGDEVDADEGGFKEDPLKTAARVIKDMVLSSPFITKLFEDTQMQLEEQTLSALSGTGLFPASTASFIDVSTAATDPCESSSSLACPAMAILKQPMQIVQTIKDMTKLDISVCFPADSAKADVEAFVKDVMAELKAKYSAQFDRLKDAGIARIRKSVDSFKAGLAEAQASIETLRDLVLGIPKRVLQALNDADMTPDSIVSGITKLAKDLVDEITKVLNTAKDSALKRINDMVVAFSDDANAVAGEAAKSVSDDVIMLRVAFKVGLQRAAKAASPCKKIGTALVAVAKGSLLEMKDNAAKAFDATNGLAVAFVDSVKRVGSIVGSLPLSEPLEKLPTLLPAFVKKAKVDLEAMLESIKKAVAAASAAYKPIPFVGEYLSKGMTIVEGRIEKVIAVVKTDTTLERSVAALVKMDKLKNAGSAAAQAGSDFAAVYNAKAKQYVDGKVGQAKDAVASGMKAGKDAIQAGKNAVASGVEAGKDSLTNGMEAGKQFVADKIAQIKAIFAQKLSMVYALGDKIQLFFLPFGDVFSAGKKIVDVLKGIILNAKDIANSDMNVAYVARFGSLSMHFTDLKSAINTIKGNVDDIDLEAIAQRVRDMRDGAVASAKGARDSAVNAAKDARDSAVKTATDAKNNLVDSTKDAKNSLVDSAKDAKNSAVSSAKDAKNSVVNSAKDAKNNAVQTVEAGRDRVEAERDWVEDAAARVKKATEFRRRRLLSLDDASSSSVGLSMPRLRQHRRLPILVELEGKSPKAGQNTIDAVSRKGDAVINAVDQKADTLINSADQKADNLINGADQAANKLINGADQKADELINGAANVVSDANIDKVAGVVSDKKIDAVAAVISDGVINNITKVVGKYKKMLSGALGKASSAVNFVVDLTSAVEGMLECAAIKGPKNVMTIVGEGRKGVVAVTQTIAAGLKDIKDAVALAKGETVKDEAVADPPELPDWGKIDAAKKEMKCVSTTLNTLAELFQRVKTPALGNALNQTKTVVSATMDKAEKLKATVMKSDILNNIKKGLKMFNPSLDLLKAVAQILPALSPATVSTYEVIQAGLNKQQKLSSSTAKRATKAYRDIINKLGELKAEIATFKSNLLAAKIVAPKVLAVLGTVNTGIGIMIAAVDVLKQGVVEMTMKPGVDINASRRRRLLGDSVPATVSSGGTGTASEIAAVLKKLDTLESDVQASKEEIKKAKEEIKNDVKRSSEAVTDNLGSQIDILQAVVKISGSGGGGGGGSGRLAGLGEVPAKARKSHLGKPGSYLECPENYVKMHAPGATHGTKFSDTRMIFEKRHTILKESLRIPPSMTYGVIISLSIEVEVELGMQLEWARCEREVPDLAKCAGVARLVKEVMRKHDGKCQIDEAAGEKAKEMPGSFVRHMFKSSLLAKTLIYCVKGHASSLGWVKADIDRGIKLTKRIFKLTSNVRPGDQAAREALSKEESPAGKYCDEFPPELEWLA